MRYALSAVLLVAVLTGSAYAQATTTQPPASGALEPQSTAPLQGATPATPVAPPAPVVTTPVTPGTSVVAPPPLGRVFASENGIIFNAIKPDKVMDFETVIAKLRAALANSKDAVRQQQGWGWKIYKATEPGPNNSVLYVFIMDPAVKGADYGVAKILSEAYPTEITDLYRMYTGAFATAGQTIVNLQPVTEAGTKGPGNVGSGATTTAPVAPAAPNTSRPAGSTPPTRQVP
jgi:hypothetical protein